MRTRGGQARGRDDHGQAQFRTCSCRPPRSAGATTASTWSMATVVPGVTSSSVTVPACGAEMTCSIFIASTTSRLCPAVTSSPTATLTTVTVPGIGAARVSAPACAAPVRAAATGSWSRTCQASPSRPEPGAVRRAAWLKVCVTPSSSTVTAGPASGPRRAPDSAGRARVAEADLGGPSPASAQCGPDTGRGPGGGSGGPSRRRRRPGASRSGTSNGSRPARRRRGAGPGEPADSSAAAAYTSSGTPVRQRASARSRSTRPVSSSPATTAGWASSRRRNPTLVGTPSDDRVRERRPQLAQRRRPVGPVRDHLGQHRVVQCCRPPCPRSGRSRCARRRPCGSCSASTVPPDGRKPRAGSSAQTRASTACPVSVMSSCVERQRLAGRDPQLPLHQVEAGDQLGHRVLDLEAGVHLHEVVRGRVARRGR